jgi:hypothetical protein
MAFAALGPQNPLEIALRQAQGDFSLATSREVILLRVLRLKGPSPGRPEDGAQSVS